MRLPCVYTKLISVCDRRLVMEPKRFHVGNYPSMPFPFCITKIIGNFFVFDNWPEHRQLKECPKKIVDSRFKVIGQYLA